MDTEEKQKPPSPFQFDMFLPWACHQLQLKENLNLRKIQTDNIAITGTDRLKSKTKSRTDPDFFFQQEDQDSPQTLTASRRHSDIQVIAIYDTADHLIKLQFQNNKKIPRLIFKIINLIIKYYEFLNNITINRGIDEYTLYEIGKFLPYSNITDICLDNTFLEEGNYHLLLENRSMLRYLSLRRCSINDNVIERLATTLMYPNAGSRSLSILNLASNRITDVGAKYLAGALRSNRQLSYLNLADNSITDIGASCILDSLLKFPLTFTELIASRSRQMNYLKEKNDHILRIVKGLQIGELDKRINKRKLTKPQTASAKTRTERESLSKLAPSSKSLTNINQALIEKASNMADNLLGAFTDPYDKQNTKAKDAIVYCHGNNSLCSLNIAYNNLSYVTLKKLLAVLIYQREMGRKPKGLINVTIEGNNMPVYCGEFDQINNIIRVGLMSVNRRISGGKKRSPAKPGMR
ncbi:unnamed protein product [Diatraea saccharalis]|uniref:Leucine-rich repeat-containing protein 71 n=1 Tax=Diatraea saccharalis TaxID=40085 RepID=A0A9N9RH05_9NEOP|nr:unnamed protein product [Diatraea saccharalis]